MKLEPYIGFPFEFGATTQASRALNSAAKHLTDESFFSFKGKNTVGV